MSRARKPNTSCIICKKPLHRKPFEFKKARYFACMNCRDEAKRIFPVTDKQLEALKLGHTTGNHYC